MMLKLLPALIVAASLVSTLPSQAARFEAAVIGNVRYPAAPLANAARDASSVAAALAEAGFSVSAYFDVERESMDIILAEIGEQFRGADLSVFYYAGHAFQYNGQNQLLAVDVDELTAETINEKRVPLTSILEATTPEKDDPDSVASLRLIIIDACRNDPFSSIDDAFSQGLSFEESGDAQTLIAYSTSAGELAFDGPRGGNGPYALAFSRALRRKGITVSQALRSVRRDVRIATESLQIPWVVGSTETDPQFKPAFSDTIARETVSARAPKLGDVVWWFLRNELTANTLSDFISAFPGSSFIDQASQRLRDIQIVRSDTSRQLVLANGAVSSATILELERARTVFETQVGFQPDTDIPAELFRIWPDRLPRVENGLAQLVTRCDLLASDPADPQRVAPPIRGGLVNIREAARACGFRLNEDPENPRILFQFGRVLDLAGRYDLARYYYLRASGQGYSAALTNLGFMAIKGRGGDVDYVAAAAYYRQAAQLGNLRARTNVGTMFVKGQGMDPVPEEGVLWYRLASGMGWPNAQNALADLYRKGRGVKKDEVAAAALYQLAAANGQRAAMNSLGRSYLAGWGVEPDRNKSHLWFQRAIAAGDRFAPVFFARDLIATAAGSADPDRVIDLFKLSADRGFRDGYRELARLYLDGVVVPADPIKAYFNARLAEIGKVKNIEKILTRARNQLTEGQIAVIERSVEQQRRLNGI